MLQTLFFIPKQAFGLPVFGLGLLLAVWTVICVIVLAWLARRQGFNADTLGYLPIMVAVGAVIAFLLPALVKPEGLPIRGYGVMMLIAVVSGTALAAYRAKRRGLNPDLIFTLAFWMFVPGILGARLFYVVEYWGEQYWPIYQQQGFAPFLGAVVNVAEGGLVVFGGLFGGLAGFFAFVRRYRVAVLPVADIIAPAMLLGLCLGRIGCLLNGCCYGGLCEHHWAVTFPTESPPYMSQVTRGQMYGLRISGDYDAPAVILEVMPEGLAAKAGLKPGQRIVRIDEFDVTCAGDAQQILHELYHHELPVLVKVEDLPAVELPAVALRARSLPVHPTQLFSSINALLLCLLLLAYDPFTRRDGELFALLLTLYPISRYLLEAIRIDEASFLGTGLSISQNISLVMLALVGLLWYYVLRQPPRETPTAE